MRNSISMFAILIVCVLAAGLRQQGDGTRANRDVNCSCCLASDYAC